MFGLGSYLLFLSIAGYCVSIKMSMNEEMKVSRQGQGEMNQSLMLTLAYLVATLLAFIEFMYLAFWFVFFNDGPTAWMRNHFYLEAQNVHATNVTAASASSTGSVGSGDLMDTVNTTVKSNASKITLILLGLFFALVAYVLFIGM